MPELPDVEGFKKIIDDHCAGRELRSVEAIAQPGQKVRTLQMPEADFAAAASGRKWVKTERRGKFLIISLDDGNSLIIHFMLSGRLVFHEADQAGSPVVSARVRFTFDGGGELVFADPRNMGRIFWVEDRNFDSLGVLAQLGVDPLSRSFTRPAWRAMTTGDHHGDMKIKELICDQTVIAGIGNVYSDFILWEARVRPERVVKTLSPNEADHIYAAIPKVLRQAVRQLRAGEPDQSELLRQRHKGGVCPRDGAKIAAFRRGASHGYYCPACQK